jgi:HEAT repeat protein
VDPTSGPPGLGLAELLEAPASPDPALRAGAIGRARPHGGVQEVLIESLADPAPEVRAAAVRALATTGGRRALEALIETSSGDASALVRAEAVAALGRILDERSLPPGSPGPEAGEDGAGTGGGPG